MKCWSRLNPISFRIAIALLSAGLVFASGSAVAGTNVRADGGTSVYVAPNGDDSKSGLDPADAVQSLSRAQQIVRGINTSMSDDIAVQLAGGTYRLSSPLTFTSADSGTNGYTINWTSAPGQTAVINGADQVTGWQSAGKGIWRASVPPGLQTRQIYVNGVRADMASGPPPVTLKRTATGYKASSSVMSTWKNPSEIEFVYPGSLGYMVEPICPVASIKDAVITMAQPCWNNSNDRGTHNIVGYPGSQLETPASIQNALPLLTQPGQFYLDDTTHELYYMPRTGQDMTSPSLDVEAPALQTLVQGGGTDGDPVEDISFTNLQFSYATWMQPQSADGFSEEQAGYFISGKNAYSTEGLCHTVNNGTCPFGDWDKEPGNVQFSNDENINFLGDQFVHLGGAGLNLDDGSQGDTVQGSVFTDISGNGIELGNVDKPQQSSQASNLLITNNYLYGIPVEFHGGVPILAGYVADTTISHNDIHDIPWAAISLGWGGWLDKLQQSPVVNGDADNTISDNDIYNFMEGLKDGGGVYTQGIQGPDFADGLTVSGNVIHGQLDWGGALKSDDGTSFVTYTNNVLYDNYYDWDGPLKDYEQGANTTFDPIRLTGNYWQQGDFSLNQYPGVEESGNHVISGAIDAPQGVVATAGLEPAYQSLATYETEGNAPPEAPQLVSALYAYKGKAWITWHPSYDAGSAPVLNYTLQACKASATGVCSGSKMKQEKVSAATLSSAGFAVYSGLSNGKTYAVFVTAHNADGASIASIPAVVSPIAKAPKLPGSPPNVTARPAAGGKVTLIWTSPKTTKDVKNLALRHHRSATRNSIPSVDLNNFVLGYSIKSSAGPKYSFAGHIELVETNTGGRVVYVISGLRAGTKYTFSVSAFNPVGTSKSWTKSSAITALP